MYTQTTATKLTLDADPAFTIVHVVGNQWVAVWDCGWDIEELGGRGTLEHCKKEIAKYLN